MIVKPTQTRSVKCAPTAPSGSTAPSTITTKSFKQTEPSAIWVISHNLGRRPIVKTYSENGVVELYGEVTHPSINVTNVLFDIPIVGIAEYI
mgnify:CR=1 FL=1